MESSSTTAVMEPKYRVAAGKPKDKTDNQQPPLYNVILWNDETHTYVYVIKLLQEIFKYGLEQAFKLTQEVDKTGRAIALTTHQELAELRQEQVMSCGPDPLMAKSTGPLKCTIEECR